MPRRARIEVAGATYHVTARGNDGMPIFRDELDRTHLLGLVAGTVRDRHWVCLAYCLMDNHYHLLVRTPEPNLSSGMRFVQTRYAKRFNSRHGRRGHVFGDRFHDRRVDGDAHILTAVAYVVLNPVRAGLVDRPEDWRWSSHALTVEGDDSGFVDTTAVLELLAPDLYRARERYRELVDGVALDRTSSHPPTVTPTSRRAESR
jgi:REP element-mobilizing transposase RayT